MDYSDRLFNAAWSTYMKYLNGAIYSIDSSKTEQDVIDWLDCIIREKVNDSRS